MRLLFSALSIAVFSAAAAPVRAQESQGSEARSGAAPRPGGQPDFIALGVGFNPEYVGADKYRIIPFGAFSVATGIADFRSSGLSVSADLLAPYQRGRPVRVELGPQVNYRFGRQRDRVDDPAVLALGTIDDAIELGGQVGVVFEGERSGSLALRAEALRDVSDVYDGWTYGLEASYTLPTAREWGVNIVANTQYGGNRFHDRYFDVTAAQSLASGLRGYDADKGFYQVAAGINLRRNLSRRWFVAGQFVTARLIDDVADSPVVERGSKTQFRGGLTVGLTF